MSPRFSPSIIVLVLLLISCGSKPKVIQPTSTSTAAESAMSEDPKSIVHKVVIEDFLHASRYTYLSVTEDDETYWIAVPRSEVEKGGTYYYQGGVRMHNFKSEEHDRIFETLFLVGGISELPNPGQYAGGQTDIDMHGGKPEIVPQSIEPIEGGVTLSQLFAHKDTYGQKVIKVKGQCVKINRNIMGKNWIHLQDGSKGDSDNSLDLTVSTDEDVPLGSIVIFEGKIAIGKDFGSGYRYDIIMEEAVIKN